MNEFFEDQRLPVVEVGPLDLAPLRRARSDRLCSDIVFFTSVSLERGDWRDPNRGFLEVVDLVGNIVENMPSTGPGGNGGRRRRRRVELVPGTNFVAGSLLRYYFFWL